MHANSIEIDTDNRRVYNIDRRQQIMGRIIALHAFVKKIMLNTISLTLYFLHHSVGADIAHLTIVEVKLKINIWKKL